MHGVLEYWTMGVMILKRLEEWNLEEWERRIQNTEDRRQEKKSGNNERLEGWKERKNGEKEEGSRLHWKLRQAKAYRSHTFLYETSCRNLPRDQCDRPRYVSGP
jgi:hypothetical protein